MFTFVQAMEGVDFKEALRQLAQKAGVELVPENPEKRSERERQYAALEAATAWYQEQLPKQKDATDYLERRGVSAETIATWRIGYAPGPPDGGWREVKQALEAKQFKTDELLAVGLIKTTEGGKEPFDVFRDRVMFPMSDASGKVVAYSGRILSKDSEAPKYVNSPETALYKKSELLYGYHRAKHGIRALGFSLIVEGQFDVVMCHQAGYNNTVAVSGTALTTQHVHLLERLSDKVVLALDSDRAGIAAMKKAADVMLAKGIDVKVAEMPEGKDPADIIVESGVDEFKKVVGGAVHVIEFLLHILKREVSDARAAKLRAREEVLPFVLLLPNRIDQEHFVGVIAAAIGSTTDAIRFELDRLREEVKIAPPTKVASVPATELTVSTTGAQRSLTSVHTWLLAAQYVFDKTRSDAISHVLATFVPDDSAEPLQTEVAAVTFTLERDFADQSEQVKDSELLAQLNLLRKQATKQQLTALRATLTEAELAEDDAILADTMKAIAAHEVTLRTVPFDETLFGGQKD
mgnify:CR=1 FL=1